MTNRHLMYRRLMQLITAFILIVTPIGGIFRLDVPSKSFVVFGQKLWFQETYLLIVTLLFFLFVLIGVIKILGRVACGWMCPRNLMIELLEKIAPSLGVAKPKSLIHVMLRVVVQVIFAFLVGFTFFSYFFDWKVILQDVFSLTFSLPASLTLALTVLSFIDVFVFHHTFCQVACPYGLMQSILGDEKTMAIHFDSDGCIKCNACTKACFLHIDPKSEARLTCVACGDCTVACQKVTSRRGKPIPLRYRFGDNDHLTVGRFFRDLRFLFLGGIVVLLFSGLLLGVIKHQSVAIAMAPAKWSKAIAVVPGMGINNYQIYVNNGSNQVRTYRLEVTGVDPSFIFFNENPVTLSPGTDQEVRLTVKVPKGTYIENDSIPLTIRVHSSNPDDPIAEAKGIFVMPSNIP
ncbi:4Fe-4S dicluster domain-containing protein [Heliophilum fasciatum]|uniref:Polyferredoxin n=1 Tax=Heliophilum fasciatum TaxID=35700 RepID=A0A4R2RH06_9FIRM|nr:4Fe-4S dicluster domain-containing protein [Heliophilum fasciatum]MCW2278911.1 polyferredoxin [Heliophilum fasciatum]TCP62044.1 polyferredoxin [Heliophilum fasciatum]